MSRYGHNGFGNYIHYSYSNYQKWGLSRASSGNTNSEAHKKYQKTTLEQKYQEEKKRIQAKIKANLQTYDLKSLSRQLAAVQGVGDKTQKYQSSVPAIQTAVVQHMRTFGDLTAEDIEWTTGTLKPTAIKKLRGKVSDKEIDAEFDKYIQSNGNGTTVKRLTARTLMNSSLGSSSQTRLSSWISHMANLNAALDAVGKSGALKDETIASLRKKMNTIAQRIDQLNQEAKALLPSSDMVSNSVFKKDTSFRGTTYKAGAQIPLAYELQQIAKTILKGVALSIVHGELMEAMVAAANMAIKGVLQDGMTDCLKGLTGSTRAPLLMSKSSFASGIDQSAVFAGSNFYDGGNDIMHWQTRAGVQGKIDVIVQVEDEKLTGISVKNYALGQGSEKLHDMNLVNGSNILYLLEQHQYFVNHYLNQTTSGNPDISDVIQANMVMKKMLLLAALAGGGQRLDITSGQQASIFVVNDMSRSNGIRVMSMNMIYDAIIKDMSGVNITLPDQQRWPNEYSSSASARITTLLAAVRAKNITASITRPALNRAMRQFY